MAYKMTKETEKDLVDVFGAKSLADMKRFKTPDWYSDPVHIKELRRKLKVSQKGFAEGLGISTQTVRVWEQSTGAPALPRKVMALLAEEPRLFAKLKRG